MFRKEFEDMRFIHFSERLVKEAYEYILRGLRTLYLDREHWRHFIVTTNTYKKAIEPKMKKKKNGPEQTFKFPETDV